jgi:drug/metabolite transporter (DMT)-like permease
MSSGLRISILTAVTLVSFAANSLICRMAFTRSEIDAASFTAIRVGAGALTLWLTVMVRQRPTRSTGSWTSAMALFAYAGAFSWAYQSLTAGTGALLLFGAVQMTMVTTGLARGETFNARQWLTFVLALGGLVWLVLPGVSAPPIAGAGSMSIAGVAWGVYSLRGRGVQDPLAESAGNFIRATVPAVIVMAIGWRTVQIDRTGWALAFVSGAITSGLGYVVWYAVVRTLPATTAAIVQLSVPVIAAGAAVLLLNEEFTQRLFWSSSAVLGGIAGVILFKGAHKKK